MDKDVFLIFQIIKRYPFKLFFSHYDFMYVTFTEIIITVIVFIFYDVVSAACHKPGSLI